MDNLTPSRTRQPPPYAGSDVENRSAGPTTRFPLLLNSDAIELTPPPPRLPPRGERPSEADAAGGGSQRPCPPLPPAPPLPAREPLRAASPHLTVSGTSTCGRRAPQPPDCVRPPLDQVVPLSHWPLPRATPSTNGGHGLEKTHVTVEPPQPRVSPTNVLIVSPAIVNHQPRPSHVSGNLYVDAPTLRRNLVGSNNVPATVALGAAAGGLTPRLPGSDVADQTTSLPSGDNRRVTLPAVVITQPSSKHSQIPETPSSVVTGGADGVKKYGGGMHGPLVCRGGIVCSRCGRCRCSNCTAPRELPRRWIGDVECSVQKCVNVTTCMCCVEAIFYHWLDGSDETYAEDGTTVGAADDPCACCDRPRCCVRWTVMTALAASILPCLCCHCPLQCAVEALTTCYNACAAPRGCRCQVSNQEASSSGGSTRGLLAESESSST